MSTRDVVEAYGLRLVLEAVIAEEAARKITPEQVSALEAILEKMKKHGTLQDVSSERQYSREFHTAVAEATRNDLLIKLYAIVTNAFPDWLLYEALFRYPELLADSMLSTYQEHVAIVDALKTSAGESLYQQSTGHPDGGRDPSPKSGSG